MHDSTPRSLTSTNNYVLCFRTNDDDFSGFNYQQIGFWPRIMNQCVLNAVKFFSCIIVVQNDVNTCNHVPFFDKQGSVSGKKFCSFAARSVGQIFQFIGLIVNPPWCCVFIRWL